MSINQLSADNLFAIHTFLEPMETLKCIEVSKQWQSLILDKFHDLKMLNTCAEIHINLQIGHEELTPHRYTQFFLDIFCSPTEIMRKKHESNNLKLIKLWLYSFSFLPLATACQILPLTYVGCSATISYANLFEKPLSYLMSAGIVQNTSYPLSVEDHCPLQNTIYGYIALSSVFRDTFSFGMRKLMQTNLIHGSLDCLEQQMQLVKAEAAGIKQKWNASLDYKVETPGS